MSAADLTQAVDLLIGRVGHWTPARWSASASVGRKAPGPRERSERQELSLAGQTRGDLLHGLVRLLADLAADAEHEPRREVPRLDNDLALVDQLRVVAADLAAAGDPDVLARASAEVTAVRARLSAGRVSSPG